MNFQVHNILIPERYGFRKVLSTTDATYKLTDSILQEWNNNIRIGGIFRDLSKAFYSVNLKVLLHKLKFYSIQGKLLGWSESYLGGRKQRVLLNSHYSQNYFFELIVKHGVSQGSVLGPLLFII